MTYIYTCMLHKRSSGMTFAQNVAAGLTVWSAGLTVWTRCFAVSCIAGDTRGLRSPSIVLAQGKAYATMAMMAATL